MGYFERKVKMKKKLIVICGLPLSGKSTIAKMVSEKLGIHWVDIDDVRRFCVGIPYPRPDDSPELMKKDEREMRAAYQILLYAADINLKMERSIIITATFSRRIRQQEITSLCRKHSIIPKIIQCIFQNDSKKEIERRLERGFGEKYYGGVNSYDRYLEVKARYQSIELPHLKIDTSPPHPSKKTITKVIEYINTKIDS